MSSDALMVTFICVLFSFIPEDWSRDGQSSRRYIFLGAFLLLAALLDLALAICLTLLPNFPQIRGVNLQETTVLLFFLLILLQTVAVVEQHKWQIAGDFYDLFVVVLFLVLSFFKAFLEPFTRVMNGVLVAASFVFLFRSLHILGAFLRDHFHRPHLNTAL
jgi:uncharacterized membrane protein